MTWELLKIYFNIGGIYEIIAVEDRLMKCPSFLKYSYKFTKNLTMKIGKDNRLDERTLCLFFSHLHEDINVTLILTQKFWFHIHADVLVSLSKKLKRLNFQRLENVLVKRRSTKYFYFLGTELKKHACLLSVRFYKYLKQVSIDEKLVYLV